MRDFDRCHYNTGLARREENRGRARFAFRMYFLYIMLTAAGLLILAPYYALRGWRRGEGWRAVRERLGGVSPRTAARAAACAAQEGAVQGGLRGAIWVHAVSVGEVLAAKPLVEGLKRRFPGSAVFVSTTTETGQRLAQERLQCADGIFYFPWDGIVPVRRALGTIRPAGVVIMETEIWPVFLREARRHEIPVIFANARISERSFARFERFRFLVDGFFARTLEDAELFLAQTPEDAVRLNAMGAPEDRVKVTGNLKYDAELPEIGAFAAWLAEQARAQERWPIVVAGSVAAEEEEAVLAAYDVVQRQWRRALLVLAPRKPARFDGACAVVATDGWNVIRRSRLDLAGTLDENADVVALDSIGELGGIYSLADAVFVGSSLVPGGGHNILEPAWFSRPPVFGPSMENFRDMANQFLAAQAGVQVKSAQQLGKVWVQLIADDALRKRMGRAARELSERNRGATARALDCIAAVLDAKGRSA